MKIKHLIPVLFAAAALSFTACDDDETLFVDGNGVALEAPVATELGGSYVKISTPFHITDDAHWTNIGYCLSATATPTINDATYDAEIPDGMAFGGLLRDCDMTTTISGLAPDTEYRVRAFVVQYNGPVVYSPELVFITSDGSLEEQLATYVGPNYPDDYTSVAGWSSRSQWNLANVHDPSVVLADDGYYYMYQTDASYGNAHTEGGHFHGRRSKDLVNWEYLGGTMSGVPEWVVPQLNEIRVAAGLPEVTPNADEFGFWAPVVRKAGDTYRMYYSIVVPGTIAGDGTWGERSFIGLMENPDPANNDGWVDKGYVICTSSDKGKDAYGVANDWANCPFYFNAIDPSYIITEAGEHWLVYGSWHSGISAVKLDATTGKPAELGMPWDNNKNYGQLIATRTPGNRWQASEGPEIIYRDGWYYLFLAYDALDVAYNTRVVRSKNITGPYTGINGTNVTAGGDAYPVVTHPYAFTGDHGWVGISHCAVFDDGQGNWFYASQGRFPANWNGNEFSNALMMGHIRSIRWTSDGWPVVMPERYGAVPNVAITEDDIVGTWEVIDLSYKYGEQKTGSNIVLGADHKVLDGIWKDAEWTLDSENQRLKVGDIELCLSREADWESTDRHAIVVFGGYSGTATFWGKKL